MASSPVSPYGMVVTRPSANPGVPYSSHHIGSRNQMKIDRFCVTVTPDGFETMQAVDPEGNVYFRRNRPWAEGWQESTTNNQDGVNGPMSSWRFCEGTGGLFCVTAANVGGVFTLLHFHAKGSPYYTGSSPFTLDALPAGPATPEGWAPGTFAGHDGVFACLRDSGVPSGYSIQFVPLVAADGLPELALSVMVDLMSSVQSGAGDSYLFYSDDADCGVYFLDTAASPSAAQRLSFEVTLPAGVRVGKLEASVSTSGQPQVFCRDSKGTLWHAAREASTGSFPALLPLAAGVVQFSAAKSAAGYTVLYTVGRDGLLTRWEQDVDAAGTLGWRTEAVTLPALNTEMPEFLSSSYAVLVTVEDSVTGIAWPGEMVSLRAEEPLMIECNGLWHEVGPQTPAELTTDASGKLKLRYAADALDTPVLKLSHASFPGDGGVLIDCAAAARVRLGETTAATFASASTPPLCAPTREPLLQGEWPAHADLVKQYTGALLEQVPELDTSQAQPFLNRGRQRPGVAHVAFGWGTRVLAAAPLRHWQMNFGKDPSFEVLDAEEAARRATATGVALPGGDLFSSIADLWAAVTEGVAKLVTVLRDAAKLTITFVVDGVQRVLQAVLETARDAVNALQSALADFGARLKGWLDWLGDLFAWGDIWKTKVALEKLWAAGETVVYKAIEDAQNGTHTFFKDQEEKVTAYFAWLETASQASGFPFQSFGTINTVQKQPLHPSAEPGDGMSLTVQEILTANLSNNWLFDQVLSIVGTLTSDPFGQGPFADLVTDIEAMFDAPAVKDALAGIETLGKSLQTAVLDLFSGKDYQTVLLSDMLRLLRDLVLAALKLIDAAAEVLLLLLAALFRAFDGFVKKTVELGFLSKFYREVVAQEPEELSLLHLGSLLVAVPMTLMFKLAEGGRSPVADEPGGTLNQDADAEFRVWARSIATLVFGGFDLVLDGSAAAVWLARMQKLEQVPGVSALTNLALAGTVLCSGIAWFAAWPPGDLYAAILAGCKGVVPAYALMSKIVGLPGRSDPFGLVGQTFVGVALLAAGIATCVHNGEGDKNAIPDTLALMPGVWLCAKAAAPLITPTPAGAIPPLIIAFFDLLNAGLGAALPLVQFSANRAVPA